MATKTKLKKFQEKAKANLQTAKKKFVAAEQKTRAYVRKNPEKAALIAAAIGAAIGAGVAAALRRRKK
ncbi:hypothetical protein J4457_04320 [Candidatus Woesearchaeota archaeon]|nr:hypothetical protein [Candidatus Woesearchaeota archaeon]